MSNPIELLPELPDDLADAFEGMKLAIMRHRRDDWREISQRDVNRLLGVLRELAGIPAVSKSTASAGALSTSIRRVFGQFGWDAPTAFVYEIVGPLAFENVKSVPSECIGQVRRRYGPTDRPKPRRQMNDGERAALAAKVNTVP